MSSTNRSDARKNHIADYYVTPQKAISKFLEKFCEDEKITLNYDLWERLTILDPCAWWDIKNDMSYPAVIFEFWADYNKIITNDIRQDSPAKYHFNFLETNIDTFWEKPDIVITNPPFNIAQNIIEKSLEIVKEGGYVIMLLRLNYFGGKVRQNFWKKHLPIRAYVHNRRMSFTPDGATDSVEYMHCVWKKWENPKGTKLSLIYDF